MKKKNLSINLSALSIISIVAAVIAAVTICTFIFANVYTISVIKDAHVTSEQAVEMSTLAVNSYFHSITDKLSVINDIISQESTPESAEERLSAFTLIQNDIYAITVYDTYGNIISCVGSGGKLKNKITKDLSFDKALFDSAKDFSLSVPHVQTLFENEYPWVVTLSSIVHTPVPNNGRYIAIDFLFSEIAKYIDNIGIGTHGYCFIIDKNGEIIYHPQQQLLFSGLKRENTDYLLTLPDGISDEKNIIYTIRTTDANSWRVVGISYTDDLAADRRLHIFISLLLSFFLCALILFVVLVIYSKKVNEPIKSLVYAMKNFEADANEFSYKSKDESVTEIKVLSRSFEHMSVRIMNLMDRIRQEEKELRKIELKALQAQINPHFLYNTLDSIQWMCEQGKTEAASEMVSALARLFRISISQGKELIPIKDEILHAKNYLIIQSFRYRDQFTYSFEIEPGLEKYLCNKITIQPLIENAIYHGIDRLVDEGKITISVKSAENCQNDILITVEDNGVGMSLDQCRAILQKEHSDSRGIGVKNVNDRLKIYFGDKYGIFIHSELDVGTAVTVRIPKIEKEPDLNE